MWLSVQSYSEEEFFRDESVTVVGLKSNLVYKNKRNDDGHSVGIIID